METRKREVKNIVVIGGGHNGLVAAAYLALDGHKVTLLEARSQVGGAASSDKETFPGFTLSTASYLNSLFLPQIVRDLELTRFGYEVLKRDPSSFTPLPDGRSLLLGPDMEFNKRQIAKFSVSDAEAYPRYEEELGEIADWMAKLMTMTPPNIPLRNIRDLENACRAIRHFFRLTPSQMYRLARLLFTDPVKYLDSWFESDVLKATLLTDAMIGAVDLKGYVLLHHVMGEAGGARGVWGYMRGGMGGISQALRFACEDLGVNIITDARVERIETKDNQVAAVLAKVSVYDEPLRDSPTSSVSGRTLRLCGTVQRCFNADIVVSAMSLLATFRDLLQHTPKAKKIARKLSCQNYESASMKINCILSALPNFRAMPGISPGPQHRGTIHISPSVEYIKDAEKCYKEGKAPVKPILEITIPSVLDETLAPPGRHVMNIFLQFYPYQKMSRESPLDFCQRTVLPILREYITNIDAIVEGVQVLAPADLEREFGMEGGNIFHGAMNLSQLFSFRPMRGMADYRTPIFGLYLAGAGTHPGGGVTGACGYNAAHEIAIDIEEEERMKEMYGSPYMFPM